MPGEKSAVFSAQVLQLIFNGTTIPNLAINATSAPLTNLFCGLATADPTASGNQATNEVSYTGYARVAVARTSGGWVQSGQSVSPVGNIVFPTPTGAAGQVASFFVIGVASSGAATFLYAVPIAPTITIAVGIPPSVTTASLISEA